MTWCVDTLKIIGEGLVEKSNLCSFELDLVTFNNFLIINKEFEVVIKVIVFSQPLFESTFLEKIYNYLLCTSLNTKKENLAGLLKKI